MAPDLNSLPPSALDLLASSTPTMSSSSNRGDTVPLTPLVTHQTQAHQNGDASGLSPGSPSPRSASVSLQAAATLNAGLQRVERRSSSSSTTRNRQSPSAGRRRSQVLMNIQLADPSVPGPGEMVPEIHPVPSGFRTGSPQPLSPVMMATTADPHHHTRTPSLGELHQELENEQEFQVNRLLQEIRRLQAQLAQRLPSQSQPQPGTAAAAAAAQSSSAVITGDEASDRSVPVGSAPGSAVLPPAAGSLPPRSPVFTTAHPRSSFDMARADLQRRSRTPSRGASPRLRSTSFSAESAEQLVLGGRDESAFYQAETQMLIRENQMLRHRIRDLERQLSELTGSVASSPFTHEPSHSSHLMRSTSASEDDAPRGSQAASLPTVTDAPKEE